VSYLWVALGGALGSVARFATTGIAVRMFGAGFPWGTLLVNVFGSFAIGVLAAVAMPDGRPLLAGDARAFVIVGMLGGFTTFSAFSVETLSLARNGAWLGAGANVLLSVVVCLVAVWLGYLTAAVFNR
jgi:CrcB protein